MKNLFKKATYFTDIHFGKKNNSRQFNIDCENFIQWFVEESKQYGADVCIFGGDFMDNRRFINVSTLNYALSNLELLNNSFEKVYMILGNHDLYYREKREINSVEYIRNLPNIELIKEIKVEGNVALVPWLIGDEYKEVKNIKAKYIFGHFELPHFLMNAMTEMPAKGELEIEDFEGVDLVFSGHFHKRQRKRNILYTGNAFPHNFQDSWDFERGMMFLEWGKEPVFKTWPNQPVYLTFKLSELLEIENINEIMNENVSARIITDIDMSYEEIAKLREEFHTLWRAREITLIPNQKSFENDDFQIETELKTVDQIVIEGLQSLEETDFMDSKLLVELYNQLEADIQE